MRRYTLKIFLNNYECIDFFCISMIFKMTNRNLHEKIFQLFAWIPSYSIFYVEVPSAAHWASSWSILAPNIRNICLLMGLHSICMASARPHPQGYWRGCNLHSLVNCTHILYYNYIQHTLHTTPHLLRPLRARATISRAFYRHRMRYTR